MKCLLCRIRNQHAELLKHPNDATFNTLQMLWNHLGEIIGTPKDQMPPGNRSRDTESIAKCSIHSDDLCRDIWFDEMGPKMHKLMTEGIKVKSVVRRPSR